MSAANCERELRVLEEALRRLSAEYDAFLYGSVPKPPVQTRRNVEEMVRRLNATEDMSAAERYRFGTLQGRFRRSATAGSGSRGRRRPGAARASTATSGRPAGGSRRAIGAAPNARPAASVQEERRAAPPEPDRELFDRYLAAKKARGEDVSGYRLEGFVEGLERERRKVRERLGEGDIVFDVAERDGRVRLVAKKKPRGGA